ncbi:DapH/DapD/GlmU-related protein [Kitasatospora viridis]|uniref:Transferase family hexapeptide repeat protein n=1 Tax=Kitasatospora viridis TaxID=281105 RepID=A0A561T6C5_9ACTN|nr:hypothetical protein [Kitasatospora viridis]TWF82665.1 transferase family hexapeptide repeat protein [Kitasatospora viridis]
MTGTRRDAAARPAVVEGLAGAWRHRLGGARIAAGVRIGRGSRIRAAELTIGAGVVLGRGVRIEADRVVLEAGTEIGDRCRISAREVEFDRNCVLFPDVVVRALTTVRLGAHTKISRDAVLKAGSIEVGTEFWMNRGAEIGGGGWRTGDGRFQAGDRCHVGRGSHINTARPVVLGDDTAIGMDCTIATHAHWQPATEGFPFSSGPVTVGSGVAVFTRSVVSPGVTVADGATVAAGSVVVRDVAPRALVGGVPARTLRIHPQPESPLPVLLEALGSFTARQWPTAAWRTGPRGERAVDGPDGAHLRLTPDHLLHLAAPASRGGAECVFDLGRRVLTGTGSELSEALRNHLFSIGLRFRYEGYQRAPLSLRRLRESGIEE